MVHATRGNMVTTRKRSTSGRKTRATGARSTRGRAAKAAPPVEEVVAEPVDEPTEPADAATAEPEAMPVTVVPEPEFAARYAPPAPAPPRPTGRRAVFFDVENTSRPEHVESVLRHLALDRMNVALDLIAVGNWRVVGHDTARILARRGAQLVHSAPSVGVRDWSDLRIAVAAGVWLAGARPGDTIDIVSDDQAFDAVGDVAASLGVTFRRMSYRTMAGIAHEAPVEEAASSSRGRRSRRGGRRRRGGGRQNHAPAPPPPVAYATPNGGGTPPSEPHTAPHDEIVAVVRELMATLPAGRGVSIDLLSNALKARGFSRPPGSPRLVTRLRRIKELEVSRTGMITLLDRASDASFEGDAEPAEAGGAAPDEGAEGDVEPPLEAGGEGDAATANRPRRRRRRGGRRRRGRGGGATAAPSAATP